MAMLKTNREKSGLHNFGSVAGPRPVLRRPGPSAIADSSDDTGTESGTELEMTWTHLDPLKSLIKSLYKESLKDLKRI